MAALVLKFDQDGKPVLGSCLGAQALAHAFGGKVSSLGFSKLGFAELVPTLGAVGDPMLGEVSEEVALFEMHGDTFSLPPGATLLLEGKAVPNQAFRVGNNCYGFQCHFEATHAIAEWWIARELRSYPRISPDELTATIVRLDQEFEIYGAREERFAATVVGNWPYLCKAAKIRVSCIIDHDADHVDIVAEQLLRPVLDMGGK